MSRAVSFLRMLKAASVVGSVRRLETPAYPLNRGMHKFGILLDDLSRILPAAQTADPNACGTE